MIFEGILKDAKTIFIENNNLRVAILPGIGGKIASIFKKDKEFELLFQNPKEVYQKGVLYDDFGNYDASGFDDCFPTINDCRIHYQDKEVLYPNHGEVWSTGFNYEIGIDRITMDFKSAILPYSYKKSCSLNQDQLVIEYEISNHGEEDLPCIWAMHCLIRCEEDMQLMFPKGTKEILNVYSSKYLGEVGRIHPFPITTSLSGQEYPLDRILPLSSDNAEKYYVRGKVTEGVCGAYYPQKDISYRVYWDKEKLPYLGFWITEGAFRGDYNCALEPANGYYDDIPTAKSNGSLFILESSETFSFSICIELATGRSW